MESFLAWGMFTSMMCMIGIIPFLASLFSVGILVLWVLALVDAIQRRESDYPHPSDKTLWIIIVLLGSWVGSLLYYLVVYRERKRSS